MIGGIVAFTLVLLLIGSGVIGVKAFIEEKRGIGGAVSVFAVVMIICLVLIPASIKTVDTGEIAVVKHLGEATKTRTAGTHFDLWITESYQKYDTKVQNMDIVTASYSSDAQTMDVAMTLQYQIMSDKVIDIANQYGSLEALQSRIQSVAIEKTKAILSSHTAMNIISNRAAMSPMVEEAVKTAVDENYFVNITTVVLTNIDFSNAFEQAVEEKMIAEQNKLKAEYENQTKIAQAEAEAKVKVTQAQAEADAIVVAAKAEKEANEMLEQSITDKILQKAYLDKWNGKLPDVIAGEEASNIMITP